MCIAGGLVGCEAKCDADTDAVATVVCGEIIKRIRSRTDPDKMVNYFLSNTNLNYTNFN